MRHVGRWAALVLLVLSAASGEARPFYALSGGRILGCGPNDTLTIDAECTNLQPTSLSVRPCRSRGETPREWRSRWLGRLVKPVAAAHRVAQLAECNVQVPVIKE